ncbi:NAD(P)/FAD-dependent oxidoreductase [Nocardioides zeae]|uniref:NAD(P)/FAD-dependent oxidoreductase n=1 Tax=Nocardioides imazamoxiresistens TaxID=3231893 RepID=A0ABU3PU48_9ACTN|nr:NAD(P)/FAD-dependent oxidoreductase [Nocardioides zeae]MDT9592721.1 NAD(P)/FAD-dependent oxidoreductase [Nocardioides zeae]
MSEERTTPDVDATVDRWLEDFATAVGDGDPGAAPTLFDDDAWWRDLLAFTWDLRTAHGLSAIARLLADGSVGGALAPVRAGAASLVDSGAEPWIQAVVDLETPVLRGRGVLRLVERDGAWKAWTLLTAAESLVGHEERTGTRRPAGGAQGADRLGRGWADGRRRRHELADGDPAVLVVGAGHSGLGLAARLGCMGVDTLVVDRNERIGDNWRHRYDSLVLHDPVWYDHLPYVPFPSSWPVFTPKDKLADWLESYAGTMDLNVWTGTELVDSSFDPGTGTWTVTLTGPQGTRTIRPRHVVLATGVSGTEPNVPDLPGAADFDGTLCHSSGFPRGADLAGRRAVVVGSCNSGHDIAQELYEKGAAVTMVQRSPTYVVSVAASGMAMAGLYDETGPPTDVADLLGASFPFAAVPEVHRATTAAMAEVDRDILTRLEQVGFLLSSGIDGTGALQLFLQKGGGYYIDVGASALLADGLIGLRSGVGVARVTPGGLELDDGTSIDADLVVLATGYQSMVATARRLLGDEVAGRCGPVWGLDEEGELRGVWRRSGHDGLWFMGGNLAMARFYGGFLALQILAAEVGAAVPDPSTNDARRDDPASTTSRKAVT